MKIRIFIFGDKVKIKTKQTKRIKREKKIYERVGTAEEEGKGDHYSQIDWNYLTLDT